MMNRSTYPVECCVDLRKAEQHWLEDLSYDSAYLDTILYFSRTYTHLMRSRRRSVTVLAYMNEVIAMLQAKLAHSDLSMADSTIFTILVLAVVSEGLGGIKSARDHLNALHQLIALRGGIATLSLKRSLQMECCRFVRDRQTTRVFW